MQVAKVESSLLRNLSKLKRQKNTENASISDRNLLEKTTFTIKWETIHFGRNSLCSYSKITI